MGIRELLEKFGWDGKHSDPGWKTFGSGIRDKHPGSATLVRTLRLFAGKIRAHKFLLRLVSEVFLTQFSPRFSDSNQGKMPPILYGVKFRRGSVENVGKNQCWGSGTVSGSAGSACFWAS
jgi:hypothetical protein